MAILNMFGGGGNGVRIPLEAPDPPSLVGLTSTIEVKWTDPVNKVASPGGELVSEWSYSVLVRKEGSAPTSPNDGVQLLTTKIRDQYKDSAYVDQDVTSGTTYYYAVYSYTTLGLRSEPGIASVIPVEKVQYQGLGTPLRQARRNPTGISIGDYALFCGGYNNGDVGTVDTYNSSLTRGTSSNVPASTGSGTTISGHYAVYCSGYAARAYDAGLTIHNLPNLTTARGDGHVAASVGTYAIIEGGDDSYGADIYNETLTKVTTPEAFVSVNGTFVAASEISKYAMFAGGRSGNTVYSYVRAVDSDLVTTTPNGLSRDGVRTATHTSNHVLFGGMGYTGVSLPDNEGYVDAYDSSLTRRALTRLTVGNDYYQPRSTSVTGIAVFIQDDNIQSYNSALTKLSNIEVDSSVGTNYMGAASVANYALFAGAGGSTPSHNYDNVLVCYT